MHVLNERYALRDNEEPRTGGMAEIYRAFDVLQDQHVAIKFFKTDAEAGRLHLEAYSRECRALQRLDHPNIVQVLDVGMDPESGRRFLVLEWLETPLVQYLADHPLDGWDSFYETIGRPILDGLVYAYSQDVLHRDLKPHNVLFSSDGVIKVVDFGISKLRSYVSPGLTVAGFRSEPYAPPEPDDGTHSESRDVFGFAVLALNSLSDAPPVSYEDVYRDLEEFDGPPEIATILQLALSRNPEQRHDNVVALKDDLDKIQAQREAGFGAPRRRCYVKITRKVEDTLRKSLDHVEIDLKHLVLDDLNEICGLKRYEPSRQMAERSQEGSLQIALYAAQYLYHGFIDQDSRSYLVVSGVSAWQPSFLEFQRDSAWIPDVAFHLQIGSTPPRGGTATMEWLVASMAEHETALAEQRQAARGDELFRKWTSILHAKSDVEQQRETPISYDGFERTGNRLKLFTGYAVEGDIVGQPRLITVAEHGNSVVAGEVEAVGDGFVVLWVEDEITDQLPERGKLQFDTRASRRAIHRQRQALDAVRFGRSARSDLRDLLIDPENAPEPTDPGEIEVDRGRLDESKRQAVVKALGTNSFLVVEGPPGTGKTRFITEVVIQTLKRSPEARILLTSQTHVALDNALEQIRQADGSLRLVRIGHRHDERVSREVEDLLLENRVDKWLASVRSKSEQFLSAHAAELGVDRTEIELGMAAARLRASLDERESLEQRMSTATAEVANITQRDGERAVVERGDTYHEFQEELRESRDTAKRLEVEVRRARRRVKDARTALLALPDLGTGLAALGATELREWEEAFLDGTDASRRIHRFVSLAGEWYLRFGRSRDFFAALIADSEVIAGTCLGFAGVHGIQNVEFDLCIVDEASKATVTELLVPLSRSRKWILVGDRKQLPPFVEDALGHSTFLKANNLAKEDVEVTLLDVLADRLPRACVTSLVYQHRMVRQIGDLVSHCFYGGELQSLREGDSRSLAPALPKPVTWFDTTELSHRHEVRDHGSYKNVAEVEHICRVLKRLNFLARVSGRRYDVAVLSGYASQKLEIRRALNREQKELESLSLECNTVDAFQGREADIAIYSVTRCNGRGDLGFLRERRRLNVALSRARVGLGIVGDSGFLRSAPGYNPWTKVLDYMETHREDCAFEVVS